MATIRQTATHPKDTVTPNRQHMEIIEQNLTAKNPKAKSEDGIVVTADFIAVIDGSTSKSRHRHSWLLTNGRYAMQIVSRYVRRMPKTTTCEQFLRGATAAIRRHYSKRMLAQMTNHPEDRLTCSAIVYSRVCRELWLVGDCHCLVTALNTQCSTLNATDTSMSASLPPANGSLPHSTYYDNPKPAEAELAAMRAEEARRLMAEGITQDELLHNDKARDVIIPRMLETMRQQNITYSVLDGFPVPRQHVRIVTLDFQPWEIVMATDGYPFLCATLAESEQLLQQQRLQDPLNIGPRFQATKAFNPDFNSFDDRTYVRFRV